MKRPEEGSEGDEEYSGAKRPYIQRNQLLARERFNNFNDRNPSGFSGFGGQPSIDSDEFEPPPAARDNDRADRSRSKRSFKLNISRIIF